MDKYETYMGETIIVGSDVEMNVQTTLKRHRGWGKVEAMTPGGSEFRDGLARVRDIDGCVADLPLAYLKLSNRR